MTASTDTNSAAEGFVVIVEFQAPQGELDAALAQLDDYIGGFLSHHRGFIESSLQHDGESSIVHVARWQTEADFRAFAAAAADHPALPALRLLNPSPRFLTAHAHFRPPASAQD